MRYLTAQKSPENRADRKSLYRAGYGLTHILIRIKRLCEPSDILDARDKDGDGEEIVGREIEAEREREGGEGGGGERTRISFRFLRARCRLPVKPI